MLRITTNGMLRSYQSNLMKSTVRMYDAQNKATTLQNFDCFAESPVGASRSFKLRSDFSKTNSQLGVTESTLHKFYSAYSVIDSVVGLVDNREGDSSWASALKGVSDTAGAGRTALGQQMSQLAESILQDMNTQYEDYYLFSGADGLEIPFTWEGGELCYRGVPVDTAVPALETDDNEEPLLYNDDGEADVNGAYYKTTAGDLISIEAYDQRVKDLAKLDYMSGEARYVDIGIGLKEDEAGNLIPSSTFNNALQAINFLGYGVDENGDPNNLISIIGRMGEILSNCDEDSGEWAGEEERAEFQRLLDKFENMASDLKEAHVELSAKADFLDDNKLRLEEKAYTLNEQLTTLEMCDPRIAYTDYFWALNCYNAALQISSSVLPPNLLDFLN